MDLVQVAQQDESERILKEMTALEQDSAALKKMAMTQKVELDSGIKGLEESAELTTAQVDKKMLNDGNDTEKVLLGLQKMAERRAKGVVEKVRDEVVPQLENATALEAPGAAERERLWSQLQTALSNAEKHDGSEVQSLEDAVHKLDLKRTTLERLTHGFRAKDGDQNELAGPSWALVLEYEHRIRKKVSRMIREG